MTGPASFVDPGMAIRFRRAARALSGAVAVVGAAVLAGWALDIETLKSVDASFASMKPNTALAFVMIGWSLWCHVDPAASGGRRLEVARVLAVGVGLLAGATLLEYAMGWNLGIDKALFVDRSASHGGAFPGRMAPATAFQFILIAGAVLLFDARLGESRQRPAEWLALLAGVSSLLALLGYLYDARTLYQVGPYTSIALHTTMAFLACSVAVLFARPERGLMRLIASDSPGGVVARRLLPAAFLLPAALGWLRLMATQARLINLEFGLALHVASTVVCFATLVLLNAVALTRADRARALAAAAVRESEADLAITLDSIGDAVVATDVEGRIVRMNPVAEQLTGWTAAEGRGHELAEVLRLVDEDTREPIPTPFDRILRGAAVVRPHSRATLIARDGSARAIAESGAPIRDADGHPRGAVLVLRDQTEERRAAEALRASEARFRRLVESGLIGIVVADADGAILDANDAFLHMIGFSREALVPGWLKWGDLAPPESREVEQAMRAMREASGDQGGARSWEQDLLCRDGNRVAVMLGVTRLDASRTIAFVLDLTERKQAEAAIQHLRRERAADAKFRALLEAAPDAMVIADLDGRIVLVNGETERVFRYAREEILGQPVGMLLTDGSFDLIRHASSSVELRGRRKDGSQFPIEVSLGTIETEDGLLLSSAIRDISQRKQAEEGLRRAKEEAETAMGELEAFSYSVAHDLRSPLRSINGFSSALLEDWSDRLDAEARDYLVRIGAGAERMGQLIDSLLTLARVSRADLEREPVDLTRLARTVIAQLRAGQPERTVEVMIQDEIEGLGDPQLLRVLLENLLENAWKFSERRRDPHIEFGCTRADRTVYYVTDNGAGFDMAYVDKLFTPFQRLHAAGEFAGTGIGLATAQRIVRRHGGRIWAESVVDQGATFRFTLRGPADP